MAYLSANIYLQKNGIHLTHEFYKLLSCCTRLSSWFTCTIAFFSCLNLINMLQHGMGIPSVGILLHEVIKLMYHAQVCDPIFFRIGTSGGIGIEGGSVVISEEAVDGMLSPHFELVIK